MTFVLAYHAWTVDLAYRSASCRVTSVDAKEHGTMDHVVSGPVQDQMEEIFKTIHTNALKFELTSLFRVMLNRDFKIIFDIYLCICNMIREIILIKKGTKYKFYKLLGSLFIDSHFYSLPKRRYQNCVQTIIYLLFPLFAPKVWKSFGTAEINKNFSRAIPLWGLT